MFNNVCDPVKNRSVDSDPDSWYKMLRRSQRRRALDASYASYAWAYLGQDLGCVDAEGSGKGRRFSVFRDLRELHIFPPFKALEEDKFVTRFSDF